MQLLCLISDFAQLELTKLRLMLMHSWRAVYSYGQIDQWDCEVGVQSEISAAAGGVLGGKLFV